MGRVIAIDYGKVRSGIAWTDPLKIIASAVGAFATPTLLDELKRLLAEDTVEAIVIGVPVRLDGSPTDATQPVQAFIKKLRKKFADIPIYEWDERFTSKRAVQEMILAGVPQKKRRNKSNIDALSATLILQEFLDSER